MRGTARAVSGSSGSALESYISSCQRFGVDTDAGVLVALRFGRKKLRTESSFCDKGMLPLADVLLSECLPLGNLRVLDFSHAQLTSHGAIAIAEVLNGDLAVKELRLQHNKIGAHGARALALALVGHTTLKRANLRGCLIGEKGAAIMCRRFLCKQTSLESLDLSLNVMGYQGMVAISRAIEQRSKAGLPPIEVNLQGNAVAAEVMNAVTHGLGFVLCIVGTVFMGLKVAERGLREPDGLPPNKHVVSITVYCISLCVLYISSTLYHSFFALTTTRAIFSVFDQSAIYILIAGSYTPFLGITFEDKPVWSVQLLGFLWVCCLVGIYIEAAMAGDHGGSRVSPGDRCTRCTRGGRCAEDEEVVSGRGGGDKKNAANNDHNLNDKDNDDDGDDDDDDSDRGDDEDEKANDGQSAMRRLVDVNVRTQWKAHLSLGMYLGMGWAALFVLPDLMAAIHPHALALLIAGGLCYTMGVPFFVRDRGMDHAIWHVFVLAGSVCHYLAIYFYIVPLD